MKPSRTHTTHSPIETHHIAQEFAAHCVPGTIVCLHGDLGAGKTTFVKGLAQGMGITDTVKSPSFTLINEYGTARKLYHMDLYRLKNADLNELGLEDYLGSAGVCVIEWAERLAQVSGIVWHITITRVSDTDRHIRIEKK